METATELYEHIIRTDADLHHIQTYTQNNPRQWELNDENPANTQ